MHELKDADISSSSEEESSDIEAAIPYLYGRKGEVTKEDHWRQETGKWEQQSKWREKKREAEKEQQQRRWKRERMDKKGKEETNIEKIS